jgi:hypothetical protein
MEAPIPGVIAFMLEHVLVNCHDGMTTQKACTGLS